MVIDYKGSKGFRMLSIYERLNRGEQLQKAQLADDFGVGAKTIQRDIDDLRDYIKNESGSESFIRYDRRNKVYKMTRPQQEWLTKYEATALCRILLGCRAFRTDELDTILLKLISNTAPEDREEVSAAAQKERAQYIPLMHNKRLLSRIWELTQAVHKASVIQIDFERSDGILHTRLVKPAAVTFSGSYFYLIAFDEDDKSLTPRVFRVDKIRSMGETDRHAAIFDDDKKEREFRKRMSFMESGELEHVDFYYSGKDVESLMDCLPTANITQKGGEYRVRAEVYGSGIHTWIRSQGDKVRLVV